MWRRFSGKHVRFALFLGAAGLAFASQGYARTWTTISHEHFEADFVRVEGASGIFWVRKKECPYPLNRLSAPDRLFMNRAASRAKGLRQTFHD